MIVRILASGQFELDGPALDELNRLDDKLTGALERDDEPAFRRDLTALLDRVRSLGHAMPDDYLGPSDLVLPDEQATIADVRTMLGDEGLIPD